MAGKGESASLGCVLDDESLKDEGSDGARGEGVWVIVIIRFLFSIPSKFELHFFFYV